MATKQGRPPKKGENRSENLSIRLTEKEKKEISDCSERLGITRTDAIMQGISLLQEAKRE